jgi:isopentenyl diphosphate isomerase/L-lactate dehydrogenase-like FMN-dependent dehydrogenase
MINTEDFRQAARRRLPRIVFDYIDAGAGDEYTLRANREAFGRITFRPRSLVDVSKRDQSTLVFGRRIETPIIIAPAGAQRLVCREGEVATVRAAAKIGTIFALSSGSNRSIEEVAGAAKGATLWFNTQNWQPRELLQSLVERAQQAGYHALLVSIDSPADPLMDRSRRNGYSIPFRLNARAAIDAAHRLRWLREFMFSPPITFKNLEAFNEGHGISLSRAASLHSQLKNPAATWDDLKWFRSIWQGPLVVKGVLTAETARKAFDVGADGVVCSNHGGRMLDGAPATMDVLPEVLEAAAGRHKEVFLDSGVRRGTDVVKAIALGARACLVGRPFFWALAVGGERGVVELFDILRKEVDNTLGHLGRPTLADLDPSAVSLQPDPHYSAYKAP